MARRVIAFYAFRRSRARRFSDEMDNELKVGPSFLPASDKLRALLDQDAVDSTARDRIAAATVDVINGEVEFRGLGRIRLRFTPGDWYDYPAVSTEMISRQDFLVPLVQQVLLSGDPAVREKIRELFTYWTENFDLSKLRKRDTPIDTAIRLINWMWVLSFDVLKLDRQNAARLLQIIYLQLEFVSAWRSAGGNHLVLEALAHYVVGSAFAVSRQARRWRQWSRRTLLAELHKQTSEDGVHTEQSMFYHQAVSTHFLKFLLTAEAGGDPVPESYRARFGRMLEYIHVTMKIGLTHPVLGDGEPLVTNDREHWEAKALLPARSVLYGRPLYSKFAASINDSLVWLLGVRRESVLVTDEIPVSTVFEKTGLAVLRSGEAYAFFDAAPFSDPEFPHHGHADALSVEIGAGRADLFVDPGGYGYYNDEYRRFFRSTAAHNTVVLDGKDQSELSGVLGYGRLANAKLERYSLTSELDYVAGSHSGYSPAKHLRELFLRKGPNPYVLIVDYLQGAGRHTATINFHLPPRARFDASTGRLYAAESGVFRARAVSNVALEQTVLNGCREPFLQGWFSPGTRIAEPADTWQLTCRFDDAAYVATVVFLSDGAAEAIPAPSGLEIAGTAVDSYSFSMETLATACRLGA